MSAREWMLGRTTRAEQVDGTPGVNVGPADVLLRDGRITVPVDGVEAVVLMKGRHLYAFENRCPHLGRRLSDAKATGRSLVCAGHGHCYPLRGAEAKSAQTLGRPRRFRRFDAQIIDGDVWLSPRDSGPAETK